MCPKRRMHAETRKRYIRGLAAGDRRAELEPSFFYLDTQAATLRARARRVRDDHMRKRDTVRARTDDVWRRRYPKKRALAVNVLSFDDRAGTPPRPFRPIRFSRRHFRDASTAALFRRKIASYPII